MKFHLITSRLPFRALLVASLDHTIIISRVLAKMCLLSSELAKGIEQLRWYVITVFIVGCS